MLYHPKELTTKLRDGDFHATLNWLYHGNAASQAARYAAAVERQLEQFGDCDRVALFTAPGRSEVGGNHTDHQNGCVLAAAVTMDMLAAVTPTDNNEICIYSEGYPLLTVHLSSLAPVPEEQGGSIALIRGVAAAFAERGHRIGGFNAVMSSQVPKGSGLSSSAAYEVMIGTILSHLYNDGRVEAVEIAQIGQYAENRYFGKPCGLMDQMASSVGGFVAIDFGVPGKPQVRKVNCDLTAHGYTICIVNAGGNHANLTPEYAAIPAEMGAVAACFGMELLRQVNPADFWAQLGQLRGKVSDRAILRAIHFFADSTRAQQQAAALEQGDLPHFLALVQQSGDSSQELLQNIYPANGGEERSVALALGITAAFLQDSGAWRVHGGGFAGTIQAFVPSDRVEDYCAFMESVFGADCCYRLTVRPVGGYELTEEIQNG